MVSRVEEKKVLPKIQKGAKDKPAKKEVAKRSFLQILLMTKEWLTAT